MLSTYMSMADMGGGGEKDPKMKGHTWRIEGTPPEVPSFGDLLGSSPHTSPDSNRISVVKCKSIGSSKRRAHLKFCISV